MNRLSFYFISLLLLINISKSIASDTQSIELSSYIDTTIEMINAMKELATEIKINLLEERKTYEALLEKVKTEVMTLKEFKKLHESFFKMKTKIDAQSNQLLKINKKIKKLHNKILTIPNHDLARTYQNFLLAQEQADHAMLNEIENSSDQNQTLATLDTLNSISLPSHNSLDKLISNTGLLDAFDNQSSMPSPIQKYKTIGKRSLAELMQDPNYRYLPEEPREYTLRTDRIQTTLYSNEDEEQRKKELKKELKKNN